MTHQVSDWQALQAKVIGPGFCTASGVYSVLDPSLQMALNRRGEYDYVGFSDDYCGPAADLLYVSAVGGTGPTEYEIADSLFPLDEGVQSNPVIGRYRSLYVGSAAESDFRAQGSSGGLTTWLLCELMRKGRIDGVIHVKPTYQPSNLFSYQISRSVEEIVSGAGSRYYPAEMSGSLGEIFREGGRFAVTAIPSFAQEIRLLQSIRPEWRERIPYVIGLICGHQKTANYAKYLALRVGLNPAEVTYIDFRHKIRGRPASKYATAFHIDRSGVSDIHVEGDIFGTDWGWGFFKSNFSDFTEDAFNETADIVFGDAWLPGYVEDDRGTNVMIVRNQELNDIVNSARDSGRISIEQADEQMILASQSALVRHAVFELPTRYALEIREGRSVPPVRRTQDGKLTFSRRLVQKRRRVLSQASTRVWDEYSRIVLEPSGAELIASFDNRMSRLIKSYRRAQRLVRYEELLRNPARLWAAIGRKARRLVGWSTAGS